MTTSAFIRRAAALILALSAFSAMFGALCALSAHAATCKRAGHVPPALSRLPDAPTLAQPLLKGQTLTLARPNRYSDVGVYTRHGRGLQTFFCSARGGVDQWMSWRAHGRRFGSFDGVTFKAYRAVIVAAWKDGD